MAELKQLTENGIDIIPVSHEYGVFDDNGISIGHKFRDHIENHPSGGGSSDVTKAYVDSQDKVLDDKITVLSDKVGVDVSEFGAKGDGVTDDTEAIQNALDKKGRVTINKAGTYIVGRLVIDSNTSLDIGENVTLKRKDNANNYILVNKGHIESTRNENITVIGGHWDLNKDNNTLSTGNLNIDPQSWTGFGICFRFVDGLNILNVKEIGNENKYCYIIADCKNIKCDNINFNNGSDGLHFQPPILNLSIKNLTGYTDDDMVSFTAGDYTKYALTYSGDFENVVIENIHSDNAKQLVKLVGVGDGNSKFKNFRISNLSGIVRTGIIGILQNDTVDGNIYLTGTNMENIVIENINCQISTSNRYLIYHGGNGDITLRNVILPSQDLKYTFMKIISDSTDKITIDNVRGLSINKGCYSLIDQLSTNTVESIKLSNIDLKNDQTDNGIFLNLLGFTRNILLDNLNINIKNGIIASTTFNENEYNCVIRNSNINCTILIAAYNICILSIYDSNILTSNRCVYMNSKSNVTVHAINSPILITANLTTDGRSLSLNGSCLTFNNDLSTLNGRIGDIVKCYTQNYALGNGLFVYDGIKWSKLTKFEVEYNVSVGDIPANSTKEVILSIMENVYMINTDVSCNPKFHIPTGVMFSCINRDTGRIRLRLCNVTSSPITVEDGTWVFRQG